MPNPRKKRADEGAADGHAEARAILEDPVERENLLEMYAGSMVIDYVDDLRDHQDAYEKGYYDGFYQAVEDEMEE